MRRTSPRAPEGSASCAACRWMLPAGLPCREAASRPSRTIHAMADSVIVRIPADTAHVALLRAAASALAARLDFPIDRITELQIVVDEVCSRLMAVTEG